MTAVLPFAIPVSTLRHWAALGTVVLGLLAMTISPQGTAAQTTVAGVVSGALSVDETGSAGYTIPIAVPPGIAGMQPSVALVYQSHGGNGTAGVGWGLSAASSIHRCGQTLVQDGAIHGVDFSADDRFCLDGQRLVAIDGSYGADGTEYRTEIESFARIISHGSAGSGPLSFTMETKSGRTLVYGGTSDARLGVPGASEIRLWSLNEVADTLGNAMTYHYVEDTGDKSYRLDRIEYTRNDSQSVAPQSEVRFIYETRPDSRTSYLAGAELAMTKRLAAIETWTNTGSGFALVKSYDLAYETSPATARSRLTAVTECDPSDNCLQPVEFGWQASSGGWIDDALFDAPINFDYSSGTQLKRGEYVDVNGDGRLDWVAAYKDQGGNKQHTWLNTGTGWVQDSDYDAPFIIYNHTTSPSRQYGEFVDVNGDGLIDWITSYADSGGSHQNTYLNTGNGWTLSSAHTLPDLVYSYATFPDRKRGEFIDVNGDGLTDWVRAYRTYTGSDKRATYLSTGNGWTASAAHNLPKVIRNYEAVPSRQYGEFVDANGDGLLDWVSSYADSSGNHQDTYLSTGSGWTLSPTHALPDLIYSYVNFPDRKRGEFIDVNGDGLTDWVRAYRTYTGSDKRATYLSTGNGWTASAAHNLPKVIRNYEAVPSRQYGEFVDANGDGLLDWVSSYADSSGNHQDTYLSTGSGWTLSPTHALPDLIYSYVNFPDRKRGEFIDVNGDGLTDWVRAYRTYSSVDRQVTYFSVHTSDLLATITDSLGRVSTIEYTPLTDGDVYAKDSDAVFPVMDIQAPLYVVKSVSSDDGLGGQKVTSYTYAGAKVHVQGRGFRGFRQMTATDEQTGIVTTTDYSQVFPTTAQVLSSVKTLADDTTTIKTLANTWDELSLNGGDTVWPYVASSVSEDYEPNDGPANTPVVTRTATATFDDYGNPTQLETTTVGGGETFSETTENTYTNDTTNWFLGLLTRSEVTGTRPGVP